MNLFKNWDINNLAVATEKIIETNGDNICRKFYRLGHLEMRFPFPFNYINKIDTSGEIELMELKSGAPSKGIFAKRSTKSKIKFEVEKFYYEFLKLAGICNSNYTLRISEPLINWIKEYAPDVIYAQPFNYRDMVFTLQVIKATGIPLAVHIMDDSVSFSNKPNLLYFFWKRKIQNTFKLLVQAAKIHLSISDAMSAEYLKRYNKKFLPFRNPIDLDTWLPYIKKDWSIKDEVKIIYTGRLAEPNIHALKHFCKAVDVVRNSGIPVKLHIFSIDYNAKFNAFIEHMNSVEIHKAIPFNQMPLLISKFDLALLPIDFTKRGIRFAKFSISTKTSEYMISGVPIVLYAPKEVALVSYANSNGTMCIISKKSIVELSSILIGLIKNEVLRESIALNAISTAKKESNGNQVRNNFKNVLANSIDKL